MADIWLDGPYVDTPFAENIANCAGLCRVTGGSTGAVTLLAVSIG